MKLLNQSLKFLSISILLIVSVWSVILYFNLLDEIYDSIDDGLDNYKLLIIRKAERDPSVLHKIEFDESNYAIQPISKQIALGIRDTYKDTLMYMPYEEDLEPVRLLKSAFAHNGKYYQLQVISSMVEEDDLIEDLFWSIVWLYLILIVSIISINNVVLKKLWKPFYNLLTQLKSFRIDKGSTITDIDTDTKEFKELQNACEILIEHATTAYSNQKQFTENAAHELQTPLAVITSKLELLLENNNLETNDADTIAQVLQITSRLKQLNKSLLLLSKIENRQFSDRQEVSINQLTTQVITGLEDFTQFKGISIKLDEASALSLEMDKMLASILISNLIRNAIFHNIQGGDVIVQIQPDKFIVSNSSDVGALNEKEIFKRFYKNTETDKSTGLGLAIAHAICQLYGYTITYSFTGRHNFEVYFK
ncbi:HAMP domain-containing sensor histidine kinase [Limibacter armeniacum]|uniref:sensor histidine kinase n=1 Tax=Limibacter armeniacum TaxID=466084 RepID=UPI002FE5D9E1